MSLCLKTNKKGHTPHIYMGMSLLRYSVMTYTRYLYCHLETM